ncbi:nicotinate-nucleotide diphosphorylase [Neorickettsia helminthoeca str. Oregon]|uniref:nicotinate-nucleotide diphosphorylase (carboxylating) n=2 Tax=Neorickettsia helminthoeca TaxID=33994 RepID=X5HJ44_9RICK|nr:nicotinate-nucleotide diphosphorylase [Neorickettsia helminthoeca str. Oregon]
MLRFSLVKRPGKTSREATSHVILVTPKITYLCMNYDALKKIAELAIAEDLKAGYDITSDNVIDPDLKVPFEVNTRDATVVCVRPVTELLLGQTGIEYILHKSDGEMVQENETIISGYANSLALLKVERVFLNFIQRSCAIASITRKFVDKVAHTNAKIRGTRKTTPGMRCMELYAIKVGGGENYRDSLSDKVLLKDNHIAISGGVKSAVNSLRSSLGEVYITVECDTFQQVREAASLNVGTILLDNMSVEEIKNCVGYVRGVRPSIAIDASGGITLETVVRIAETGVDYISVGMLTHSINGTDIGIDVSVDDCVS